MVLGTNGEKNWPETITNEDVLGRVREKRIFFKTIDNRKGKMIGHFLPNDEFIRVIIEEKVGRKKKRPKIAFNEPIKEKINVGSYREIKASYGS